LAKENSNDNATACGFCAAMRGKRLPTTAEWRAQHNAFGVRSVATPKRSSAGDRGGVLLKEKIVQLGRCWRRISMESSNPAVVTKATRGAFALEKRIGAHGGPAAPQYPAHYRQILFTASAMPGPDPSGVEQYF